MEVWSHFAKYSFKHFFKIEKDKDCEVVFKNYNTFSFYTKYSNWYIFSKPSLNNIYFEILKISNYFYCLETKNLKHKKLQESLLIINLIKTWILQLHIFSVFFIKYCFFNSTFYGQYNTILNLISKNLYINYFATSKYIHIRFY